MADLEKRVIALESAIGITGGAGGSSIELEALKAENAALKKQVDRQNYRILHLVRGLEQYRKLYQEASQSKSATSQ